jgi:hypothetical protein
MTPLLDEKENLKEERANREVVIDRFKVLGAVRPDLGVFLPSLDLDEETSAIFLDLLKQGIVIETKTGRYHLSHPPIGSIPANRRVQIAFWVSLTIIYSIIALLAFLSI